MQEKVFHCSLSLEELEALFERVTEKSVNKILGGSKDKPDESLLTTDQVCSEYHVSRVTLIKYNKSGKLIPFSKSGKQFTYRRCDLQIAFMHKMQNMKRENL